MLRVGLFRAEFRSGSLGDAADNWISWVKPGTAKPDFHVPSAFADWRLPDALPATSVAFQTRGVVLVPEDLPEAEWPARAARAGLTTIALHHGTSTQRVIDFIRSAEGRKFLEECATLGLHVEYELHAMRDLLPRDLFEGNPELFRLNEQGKRTADANLCVHSERALEIVSTNAVRLARELTPTTSRYFLWGDDGLPWCSCDLCRNYSDSEQALLLENRLVRELREMDPVAQVAHLAYANTIVAPSKVKPAPGVFLEFAPIFRRYDVSYESQTGPEVKDGLTTLAENLMVFPTNSAQVLEYWLDISRFSQWKRPAVELPWNSGVMTADAETYARLGISHATTFAVWIDADYLRRFGEPTAVEDYGRALGRNAPQPGDADFPTPAPSERHTAKVAAVKSGDYDLVLIGDSITHTLGELGGKYESLKETWDRHFAPRKAINLGYSGYRTEQILWNLQNGELDFARSPKVAVLLIGTNNSDERHFPKVHTPEEIFAGTKAIVDLIRQRHPTTKILVLRIFPRGGDAEEGVSPPVFKSSAKCIETCRKAGELTAQLADGENVFWLDVNHVFLRPDGSINTDLMWDLLHPSPAGAEAWAQAIDPTLARLVGDQPLAVEVPGNSALVPVSKLEEDSYDWYQRHAEVLRVSKTIDPEVVLIGDSITHFWGGEPKARQANGPNSWEATFAKYRTLNLGFGWDRIQNVLWRLDHGEMDGMHPKVVVLHIGTNNTSETAKARQNTAAEIVAGIRAILQRLRAKAPDAHVVLMAVFPREQKPDHPRRVHINEINKLLAAEFGETRGVTLVDIGPRLLEPAGTISREIMPDFCHPTEKGYKVWGEALAPLLGSVE
jgi:lysophospholipase L1-like esterase